MVLENKDRKFIIESALAKFSKYAFITYDYVECFIDAIINEEKKYDDIDIALKNLKDINNVALYVEIKLKDYLYLKICRVAKDDVDVLVDLMEDIKSYALLVFKRMGIKDTDKCEDYLINAINNYDGLETFNTYLTRYLMAEIKGIPYVREEKIEKKLEEQVHVPRKYNKKPPKKPKDKNKYKSNPLTPLDVPSEEQLVAPIEEVTSGSNDEPFKPNEESSITSEVIETTSFKESVVEEPEIAKEDKTLNIQEMYAMCQKIIGQRKGNATKETFLELATSANIIEALPTSNEHFLQYLILRFGRINDSYFDIEEIMELLDISLKTVLSYEQIVISELRTIIDEKFNAYSLMKLEKALD